MNNAYVLFYEWKSPIDPPQFYDRSGKENPLDFYSELALQPINHN